MEARPGCMAWSPDGARIAYIGRGVNIYDLKTGKKRRTKIKDAHFINWLSNDNLAVLFKEPEREQRMDGKSDENSGYFLGIIDAETLEVERVEVKERPQAAYASLEGGSIIILTFEARKTKLGTETSYGLIQYKIESRETVEIFFKNATLFGKYDLHSLGGWIVAGINPADTKIMYLEYRDPPALNPYLKVNSVDYRTGEMKFVKRINDRMLLTDGSRSPNGSRIALADVNGHLLILEDDVSLTPVSDTLEGRYPSWNPVGSQIYFGGYLINSDGNTLIPIMRKRPESIALWSSDGKTLALIIGKTLWLLEGFAPYFVPPDSGLGEDAKDKMQTLRELLDEGLIKEEDYEQRYRKLLKKEFHEGENR